MELRHELAQLGCSSPIVVGGRSVLFGIDSTEQGVQLSARLALPAGSAAIVDELPRGWDAATSGDTTLFVDGDELVATRLVVDSDVSVLYDEIFWLAKETVLRALPLFTAADIETATAALRSATPPVFDDPLPVDYVLSHYYRVETSQPAWSEPDASLPPSTTLEPGRLYQLHQRWGDWARIQDPDGAVHHTDGRTLVPISQEGVQ